MSSCSLTPGGWRGRSRFRHHLPTHREDPLEKERATHSSILAVESYGLQSLMGYSPWGHKEWDTTESLSTHTADQWAETGLRGAE